MTRSLRNLKGRFPVKKLVAVLLSAAMAVALTITVVGCTEKKTTTTPPKEKDTPAAEKKDGEKDKK
jgi:predicted small lipoprotein YifL